MKVAHDASLFIVLVGVAMGCGLIISTVYQGTAAPIAENRARALEQAIVRVLPGTTTQRGFELIDDALVGVEPASGALIAGYDATGALIGVAVPAQVMGYQDTIGTLFGYDPTAERIIGFAVLNSRETPGLGAKIADDPKFLASFQGLDVRLANGGLRNPVTLTRPRVQHQAWHIDGITGATVSSQAIASAVNSTAASRFAAIRAHIEELRDAR